MLAVELSEDRGIQDASFVTALQVFEQRPPFEQSWAIGPEGVAVFEVRFSAFGRLATVLSLDGWLEQHGVELSAIATVLERHGFPFVGRSEADVPYDGPNSKALSMDPDLTWWSRYFDYI